MVLVSLKTLVNQGNNTKFKEHILNKLSKRKNRNKHEKVKQITEKQTLIKC